MSIVYNYMSLPEPVAERARQDRSVARFLLYGKNGETDYLERLLADVYEIISVGFSWDALWYLLSRERRASDDVYEPADIMGQAICGSEVLRSDVGEKGWCP